MWKRSSKSAAYALVFAGTALAFAIGYSIVRAPAPSAPTAGPMSVPPTTATLEERVRASPRDVEAWSALAAEHFGRERFAEAERAYARAVELTPSRADLWSALGEARVMASRRDPMPAAALVAFRKALAISPADPRARYFVAVQRDLSGDHAGAIGDWLALLKDTPPGAPWEGDLRRTIEQVGKVNGIDTAPRLAAIAPTPPHPGVAGIGGPTPDQMRAAAALPPGEQAAMVEGMVASVEAKLRANPGDLARWEMLMRSRMTLNQPARAAAALEAAVAANPSAKEQLEAAAAAMGLPGR